MRPSDKSRRSIVLDEESQRVLEQLQRSLGDEKPSEEVLRRALSMYVDLQRPRRIVGGLDGGSMREAALETPSRTLLEEMHDELSDRPRRDNRATVKKSEKMRALSRTGLAVSSI